MTDLNALRQSAETLERLTRIYGNGLLHDCHDTLAAMLPLIDELERLRGDVEFLSVQGKSVGFSVLEVVKENNALLSLIEELKDTELAELACVGSSAPVEDLLGRMFAAIAAMKHTEPDGEKGEV